MIKINIVGEISVLAHEISELYLNTARLRSTRGAHGRRPRARIERRRAVEATVAHACAGPSRGVARTGGLFVCGVRYRQQS